MEYAFGLKILPEFTKKQAVLRTALFFNLHFYFRYECTTAMALFTADFAFEF